MGIFDFFKKNKNIENDNGLNETYYDDGKLRESFHKKDGILNGQYAESDVRGGLKQIGKYKNGKKEGVWLYNGEDGLTDYNLTGARRWVVTYKNGVLHGKFKVYQLFMEVFKYDSNNKPYMRKNEHNHLLYEGEEGVTITDSNIEFLIEEGECVDGVKNGEWKIYEPEIKTEKDSNLDIFKKENPTGDIKITTSIIWKDGNIEDEKYIYKKLEREKIRLENTALNEQDKEKALTAIMKKYQKEFQPTNSVYNNKKHPCHKSKSPLIYINSIKDNNDINITDCYGKNIKNEDEWELKKSFINREIP
jgi:antitoxin component YwqK of YwqJK toxin-antitoxin module